MVFIKHDQVPVHRVQPLVPRFDISRLVTSKQVLKRAEIDHGFVVGDLCRVAARAAGEIVPSVKINMGFEIGLPCVFHRRLESQHQHALGAQLLR